MDVLADFRGHVQHLQIQRSGELDAVINRIRQNHFLQILLEKSSTEAVCFHTHLCSDLCLIIISCSDVGIFSHQMYMVKNM